MHGLSFSQFKARFRIKLYLWRDDAQLVSCYLSVCNSILEMVVDSSHKWKPPCSGPFVKVLGERGNLVSLIKRARKHTLPAGMVHFRIWKVIGCTLLLQLYLLTLIYTVLTNFKMCFRPFLLGKDCTSQSHVPVCLTQSQYMVSGDM